MRVPHHARVLGSRLRGTGLFLVHGDELVPARAGETLNIGALVLVGLLVRADPQVNRSAAFLRHAFEDCTPPCPKSLTLVRQCGSFRALVFVAATACAHAAPLQDGSQALP